MQTQTAYIPKHEITILGTKYAPDHPDPKRRVIDDPNIPGDVIQRLINNRRIVPTIVAAEPAEGHAGPQDGMVAPDPATESVPGAQPPPRRDGRRLRRAPDPTPEEQAWEASFVQHRFSDETQRAYLARRCSMAGLSDTGTAAVLTRRLIKKGISPDAEG